MLCVSRDAGRFHLINVDQCFTMIRVHARIARAHNEPYFCVQQQQLRACNLPHFQPYLIIVLLHSTYSIEPAFCHVTELCV
jgi:hypothetical protein